MGSAKNTHLNQNAVYANLRKQILKFSSPMDSLAWRALVGTIAFQICAILLINYDLGFLGWSLHSLNLVRLFIQFHDMAHYSFFTSILLNKLVGTLIGVIVHFPFQAWRDGHNHHHRHFGNLDRLDLSQTIYFTKKQYNSWGLAKRWTIRIFRQPIVFFLFSAPFVWFFGLVLTVPKRYGFLSKSFFQKTCSFILIIYVYPVFGIPPLRFFYTTVISQIIGVFLFHLQHSVNAPYRQRKQNWDSGRAAVQGSTFLQIPLLLKPFSDGIQYHHIHHLNTNVPSYLIQECHEQIENEKGGRGWEKYKINEVNWFLALKSLGNVMLDEEKHEVIPFSYGL